MLYNFLPRSFINTFRLQSARSLRKTSLIELTQTSTYATSPIMDPKTVSEMAKAEGGPTKGSPAAQAQSEMSKQINSELVG